MFPCDHLVTKTSRLVYQPPVYIPELEPACCESCSGHNPLPLAQNQISYNRSRNLTERFRPGQDKRGFLIQQNTLDV
jgi:hypothetical protein